MQNSVGISLAKHVPRPSIKLVENTEWFLWFKLDKTFFQTGNDFFLCDTYMPPKNTTKNILAKTDFFGNFEKAILKYKGKGSILILGMKTPELGLKVNPKINLIITYNIFYLK